MSIVYDEKETIFNQIELIPTFQSSLVDPTLSTRDLLSAAQSFPTLLPDAPSTPPRISDDAGVQILSDKKFQSPNYSMGLVGWNIDSDGNVEFNNGTFRGTFILGGVIITINNISNLQSAINSVSSQGGGIINLEPGTYNATTSFTVPSGVTVDLNGATIDFGGGARQFLIQGTNPYSTGTVSVNFGSQTVTGVGTTWTAAMIGQSIFLGDFWYIITARASNTSITIDSPFKGVNISGDTYVIATTVDGVAILNGTIQNSSISLVKGRYLNVITVDSIVALSGDIGFEFRDTFSPFFLNFNADTCTTSGVLMNNCPYATLQTYAILNGAGMSLTRVSNCGIGIGSWQRITGVALSFTNCYNIGLANYSIIEASSHGIEFVSGNNDIDIEGGYINTCGGDAIKLTASSDRINISSNSLLNSTGYGVNIAAASCDNNNIQINIFTNNTAGNVNNIGTGTKIRGNQGVSDNLVESDLSLTDITTNNFSTSKHGFVPKGTNVGSFLKDDGTWGTPSGGISFSAQTLPLTQGTFVPNTQEIFATSNTTGTILITANHTSNTSVTILRWVKDTSTGNYYCTHSATLTVSSDSLNGIAVAGTSVYVTATIAGVSAMRRYDLADLTNVTTITYSGGTKSNSMFSDGTNLYIYNGTSSQFDKFTISGTTITFSSTITYTSAGAISNRQSLICDGTNVWIASGTGQNSTNPYNIRKYPIAGGAATSTTVIRLSTDSYADGSMPSFFMGSSSILGIGWGFNFTNDTAVTGVGMYLMGITLP